MDRAPVLALLAALVGACTTSFEADQLRARPDATAIDGPAVDAPTIDAPDAPLPDVPAPDVSPDVSSACGGEGAACCASGMATATCARGLVCSGGLCVRCPGSLAACQGSCVDITSNSTHCGNCDSPCPEGQACAAGTCRLSCAAGLEPCGGTVCAQRLTDPMHCGSCGNACTSAGASATCVMGVCALGRCSDGRGDCDGNAANGCEASLNTLANCGGCRVACAPPNALIAVCETGACRVSSCLPGSADCDRDPANGCEVNTNTNAAHCGACAMSCAAGACEAGSCRAPSTMCAAGMADCSTATPGCETNVAADVTNCGACGNACTLPHATSRCAMSACAVGTCDAGFGDCDAAASGCETDVRASLAHCGACGRACTPAHATGACSMGACQVAACAEGWADCNRDPTDGCEVDLTSSAANCGACGSACAAANGTATCAAGRCAVAGCAAGFGDCDMNPGNGCEADVRVSGSNCGACGAVCTVPNATATCSAGRCAFAACTPGFADCDGEAANGCEVDTRVDPARCGGCATGCVIANGRAACTGGRCAVGGCNAGFGDCDMTVANGCEVNTDADARNCGGCGRACPSGQYCSAGACRSGCLPGTTMCGSSCVNVQTSTAHCGACGRVCSARANTTASCVAGVCSLACVANFGNCDGSNDNGCETDLRTSTRNCGGCGRECRTAANSMPFCAMGACAVRCSSGYANCDGNATNGCEVQTSRDATHCGACGNRCSYANATATCVSGFCALGTCLSGYANCNLVWGDGCEVNTNTDNAHCGGCLPRCIGSQTCRSGRCG